MGIDIERINELENMERLFILQLEKEREGKYKGRLKYMEDRMIMLDFQNEIRDNGEEII